MENYLSVQNEMLTLSLNTQIGNKVEKVAHMYYQMGKYYEHLYDLLEDDCDFALMDHIYVFLVSSLFIDSIINIIVYLWLIILFLRVYIH